jgi:hypothetical protein
MDLTLGHFFISCYETGLYQTEGDIWVIISWSELSEGCVKLDFPNDAKAELVLKTVITWLKSRLQEGLDLLKNY